MRLVSYLRLKLSILRQLKQADAVIYFGGLSHGDDRESIDRPDMKLPNSQDEIISKLLSANEKTSRFP